MVSFCAFGPHRRLNGLYVLRYPDVGLYRCSSSLVPLYRRTRETKASALLLPGLQHSEAFGWILAIGPLTAFLFKPRLISRLPVNSTCHCPSVLILSLGCTIGSPPGDPNCRTFCQLDQHLLRSGTSGHLVHGLYLLSLSMPDTMRMNHHLLCAKPAMPYERYCLPSGPCSFSTRSLFLVLRMKKKNQSWDRINSQYVI